jgi:hypothetical protein
MATGSSWRARVRAGTTSLAAAALLLAGCAAMTEQECRGANWQALGERDGNVYGTQPRVQQYAEQCRAYSVTPAESEYMAGWSYGIAEFNRRVSAGECCR